MLIATVEPSNEGLNAPPQGRIIIMELRVGFLIGFLLLAGPPLRVCRGSSQAGETCRQEIAAHSSRASAAAQEHDFAKAEEEWRKVLAFDPHSAQALNNLGMVFYLEHKYPEAEATLKKALRFDPSLLSARVLMEATLGREGKTKEAIVELEFVPTADKVQTC